MCGQVEQRVARRPRALSAGESVALIAADLPPQPLAVAPGDQLGRRGEEVELCRTDNEIAVTAKVPVQYRLSALAVMGQVGGLGSRPIPRAERPQYRFQPGIAQI